MSKGIIYVMSSVLPGLIKIGKTGTENYEQRMYNLEHNGYCNVTGMKRAFAIEVNDYDEKEALLHTVFGTYQIPNTELFVLNLNTVIQLLSSFAGTIIYPKSETNDKVFEEAVIKSTSECREKSPSKTSHSNYGKRVPDGTYTLTRASLCSATAVVEGGVWVLKKGSSVSPKESAGIVAPAKEVRAQLHLDKDYVLIDDYTLGVVPPSLVGGVVVGTSCNGWAEWKDKEGNSIGSYR